MEVSTAITSMLELPGFLASALIGAISSLITFRIQIARAEGYQDQWRLSIERRVSSIEEAIKERALISEKNSAMLAELTTNMRRVIVDIGDHDSGLRGQVHKLASDISPYIVRRQASEDRGSR